MYLLFLCLLVNSISFFGGFTTFDTALSLFRASPARAPIALQADYSRPSALMFAIVVTHVLCPHRSDLPCNRRHALGAHGHQQGALPVPVVRRDHLQRAAVPGGPLDALLARVHRKETPLVR